MRPALLAASYVASTGLSALGRVRPDEDGARRVR
jgi:hypothetical protein